MKSPTPRTTVGGPGLPTVHGAGDRFTIPAAGFTLAAMWVTSDEPPGVGIGGQFGECMYESQAPEVDERALYGPHCLGLGYAPLFNATASFGSAGDAERGMIFQRGRGGPLGEVRYGIWYTSPAPLVYASATIVSVDF